MVVAALFQSEADAGGSAPVAAATFSLMHKMVKWSLTVLLFHYVAQKADRLFGFLYFDREGL
jgi:hypothetical protein